MSESKYNKKRRDIIMEGQPNCIFCGGNTPADTIDHIPPKVIFRNKQWPEDFEFSGCASCNNGSKSYDYLIGFMARFTDDKIHNEHDIEEMMRFMKSVSINYPNVVKAMNKMTTRDKRIFSRETGVVPKFGETYADLPVVGVPEEFNIAMKVQAAKITKALHFKHTGMVVPINASIRFRWYTNVNVMRGDSPMVDEVMRMVQGSGPIKRNNTTLKDQFDYKYVIAPTNDVAIYTCVFGKSFGFISFLTFDPDILEDMMVRVRAENGFTNEGFIRAQWPLP